MKKITLLFFIIVFLLIVNSNRLYAANESVTAAASAQNTWTSIIAPASGTGFLNVSVSGTWVATVTLQRSFDWGSTWHDVTTWTANAQKRLEDTERRVVYRIGVATGDYTSGTANVRLSK